MKTNQNNADKIITAPVYIDFYLPFGAKLSDVFMSARHVMDELSISKHTLLNWRDAGIISYSLSPGGKIFYFRQEIAKILFERKVCKIKGSSATKTKRA